MLAGLVMILRVIIAPNSAFAEIRDNADRYFPWSLGIVVFMAILFAVTDPLTPFAKDQSNIAIDMAVSILGSFVSAAVIYLFGRLFGGNKNWKQVFSAIFYAQIIAIPIPVVSTLAGQTASLSPFSGLLLAIAVVVPAIVWAVIVMVKSVKVINGFGTAKAFGLIVLSIVITLVLYSPIIAILYIQEIAATL